MTKSNTSLRPGVLTPAAISSQGQFQLQGGEQEAASQSGGNPALWLAHTITQRRPESASIQTILQILDEVERLIDLPPSIIEANSSSDHNAASQTAITPRPCSDEQQ